MSDCAGAHETLTFVVRLWRETSADGHDRWRGRVEHVGIQEVSYVEDVAGVARFIERWTMQDEDGMPVQQEGLSRIWKNSETQGGV